MVLIKVYDEVAQRIKAIAAEHDIPMLENIAIAREVEIGKPINPVPRDDVLRSPLSPAG
ncbi:MAG: EscU/YscU/HrcU family type III secretion system export apparatus switch protein [Planctomycetota bacterium]